MKYIVGVGNYSMYDDSIGIRVIEHIVEKGLDQKNNFTAIDLSGNVLNLTAYFNEKVEKMIIVDSAKMNLNPGEFRFFKPESVKSEKELGGFSNHEGDVLKVIELGRRVGLVLPDICCLGIVPESIRDEFGLSLTLQEKMEEYVNAAIEKINQK